MRRVVGTTWFVAPEHNGFGVYICIASFFLGGLFGIVSARHIDGAGIEALSFYLQSFLRLAQDGRLGSPSLAELIWAIFCWPILVIACSITVAGLALIPALLFGRAFLLFFSLSTLLRIIPSASAAFILLGLSLLWSLPALIALGVQSFQHAMAQRRGKREHFRLPPGFTAGILGGFAACLLVDYYVVPVLFSALSHTIVW